LNKILQRKVWLVESERYQEKKKIVRGKDNTGFRGDSLLLLSIKLKLPDICNFAISREADSLLSETGPLRLTNVSHSSIHSSRSRATEAGVRAASHKDQNGANKPQKELRGKATP